MGGWVENSAINPLGRALMPMDCMALGISPGSNPPKRASASIIGCLRPMSRAAPASARNSRCRENQAIVAVLKQVAARDPNRFIRSSALQELAQLWPVEDAVRRFLQHASSEDASNETRKIATDALTFLRERELVENLSHDR